MFRKIDCVSHFPRWKTPELLLELLSRAFPTALACASHPSSHPKAPAMAAIGFSKLQVQALCTCYCFCIEKCPGKMHEDVSRPYTREEDSPVTIMGLSFTTACVEPGRGQVK